MYFCERLEPKRYEVEISKRSSLGPVQLLQIELQVNAEVTERCEALPLAAGRIAEGVRNERQGRGDAVILEPAAHAVPISEQVLARQDQLEGRVCYGAGAGRGLRIVLGAGDSPPTENRQDPDEHPHPGDCPSLHKHFFSFLFCYQNEPFRKSKNCAGYFSAKGEILPRMHWRCRPLGNLEVALSVS